MLKEIPLSKEGAIKLSKKATQLYYSDIGENIKSLIPGQWINLKDTKKNHIYLAYANPMVSNSTACVQVFERISKNIKSEEDYLIEKINKTLSKRLYFKNYQLNARLVYGDSDQLPGLLVDSYKNIIIIQINYAGIDRHRVLIKDFFSKTFSEKKVIILDNPKYREKEMLPHFENDQIDEDIFIEENGLELRVSKNVMQKIGYYYDHRENRARLKSLLDKIVSKPKRGLDLFSYVGSWGLNMLAGGCEHVTFIDQGNFKEDIDFNTQKNDFDGRYSFSRENVFDFLKKKLEQNESYDIICSDPPAFTKSKKEFKKAYEGYLKLHKLILRLLGSNSIFVACSCTYYMSYEDFEKNVLEAARLTGRKIQLLDVGIQGFDHPTQSLFSKNTYLKYFVYLVE